MHEIAESTEWLLDFLKGFSISLRCLRNFRRVLKLPGDFLCHTYGALKKRLAMQSAPNVCSSHAHVPHSQKTAIACATTSSLRRRVGVWQGAWRGRLEQW